MTDKERIDILIEDLRGMLFKQMGSRELAENLIKLGYTRQPENIQGYTLTCQKCGKGYFSEEAFPGVQICPDCYEPPPLLSPAPQLAISKLLERLIPDGTGGWYFRVSPREYEEWRTRLVLSPLTLISDEELKMLADWVENCKISLTDENKSRAMVINNLWNIERWIRVKRLEAQAQLQQDQGGK